MTSQQDITALKARVAAQGFKLIRTADNGFPYVLFDPLGEQLVGDPVNLDGLADVLAELEARQREDENEPVTDRTLAKRAIAIRVEIEKLIHRSSKDAPIDKATADALYILADGNGETDLRTLLDDKGFYEGVDYSYVDDDKPSETAASADDEHAKDRADLRQLRERAHALGFSIASPPDVDCALYELFRERRVAEGTVEDVAEWLREHAASYRLGEVHGCLLGIQAMCTEHDELDGTLLAVVERQARLALEALQHFEIAQKGDEQ